MVEERRVAIYGGTFDPVHVGHLTVAGRLLELFALDQVMFVPAHVAPHKRGRGVTPPFARFAMLALATQGEPRFHVSTVELDAPESPYTVETIGRVRKMLGAGAQTFFVMGADSWEEITTWREWERLLSLTNTVVVTRPGHKIETAHVTGAVRARIVDVRGANCEAVAAHEAGGERGERIYFTDAVSVDVSATAVRRLVREGREGEAWRFVPPAVAEFIGKYDLYRKPNET